MSSTQNDIYSPLDPNKSEIRVLALHPGSFSSTLSCSHIQTSITTPVYFEALSYTWGTEYSSSPILINSKELKITTNLETALRYLRYEEKDRILWIDAICINQRDDATEERNDQVKHMRHIYEKAEKVIAWLGPAVDGDGLVVDLVRDLKSSNITQEAVSASLRNSMERSKWSALFAICGREYWNRVWILQEIACASAVTLKFGDYELDWEDIGWIGRRFNDDSQLTQLLPELGWKAPLLSRVSARRSLQILVRKGDHPSLLTLLDIARRYKCTQPCDKVFALLGMTKEGRDGNFPIDYGSSTASIFLRAAQFMIQTTGKTNVICAREISPNPYGPRLWEPSQLDIPSWVPDWNMRPGINFLKTMDGERFFASGGSRASPTYSADGRIITLEGCQLGVIEVLGEPYYEDDNEPGQFTTEMERVVKSWLALVLNGNPTTSGAGPLKGCDEEKLTKFWQILVGGRLPGAQHIDEVWYRHMFDVARGALPVPTEGTGDSRQALQRFIQPIVVDWEETIFNRRFFTSGPDIMGVCSHTARLGDAIVILAGCDSPVILGPEGNTWSYQGEAYVHGFMHGEVDELLDAGKLKLEKFSLQ